jgi:hypothetical protein
MRWEIFHFLIRFFLNPENLLKKYVISTFTTIWVKFVEIWGKREACKHRRVNLSNGWRLNNFSAGVISTAFSLQRAIVCFGGELYERGQRAATRRFYSKCNEKIVFASKNNGHSISWGIFALARRCGILWLWPGKITCLFSAARAPTAAD